MLINEQQANAALTMKEALTVVEEAYVDHHRGRLTLAPRCDAGLPGGAAFILLPAIHHGKSIYGYKYADSFPANAKRGLPTVASYIQLFDLTDGHPLCRIEAAGLTTLKTGASAGVAAKYLARQEAESYALIGAGELGLHQIEAVTQVRDIKQITLCDLDRTRCRALAESVAVKIPGAPQIRVADSTEEAIAGADIIATCTTSTRPVLNGEAVLQGAHINGIGSFTPKMQELDPLTLARCNKIVADVEADAWSASGDLIKARDKGMIDAELYGTLGAVVAGDLPGRNVEGEITLFESVGFGALDLAIAIAVYEACGGQQTK